MRNYILGIVALATVGMSTGCYVTGTGRVHGGAVVAYSAPPPARVVVVDSRPGYVWVDGQYNWVNGQWVWYDGYWVPERTGYVYVAGYWRPHGSRYVYVQPTWRARGSVTVHGASNRGVVVTDHGRARGGVVVQGRSAPAPRPAVVVTDHGKARGNVVVTPARPAVKVKAKGKVTVNGGR